MIHRHPHALFAAAIACAAVLTGCGSSHSADPKSSRMPSALDSCGGGGTFQGVGLDPAQPRPSFTLSDTAGKTFSFATQTAGHPTLLYFGYTNCPDVCPATMADMSRALKGVPSAVQKRTYVVFVSTDVRHDTAAVLAKWLGKFDTGATATFVGLRGTQAQIDAAQTAAHITVAKDGGRTHSAQVLLFGADDYARVAYLQSTTEEQQIQHDLPLVAAS